MRVDGRIFHGDGRRQREHAVEILGAAVEAADPAAAVLRAVSLGPGGLVVGDRVYELDGGPRIFVVGAGKGSARMAAALESVLGDRITAGVVTTKYGYGERLSATSLIEAGHPLPDDSGRAGAARIAEMVRGAGDGDLVIVLISGGGSALLPAPAEGITLAEKIATTDLLLRSGAAIGDVNTVRKHLSGLKGGQLARLASPATVVTLILSDVLGNPLDAIASGPTVPDPSTFEEALAVVDRFNLREELPEAVRRRLMEGARGAIPDTPKPGDPAFSRTQAVIVGDIELAARAARDRAEALGYRAVMHSTRTEGEAREVGARFGQTVRAEGLAREGEPPPAHGGPPLCLLEGGETTVTVRGKGKGGRNQELALAAAWALDGLRQALVASFGTDGTDGPTDAAGAVADGTTMARAAALGLDARASLAGNDSYHFFEALGDLIVTGPTNTNVNDLWIGLIGTPNDGSAGNPEPA